MFFFAYVSGVCASSGPTVHPILTLGLLKPLGAFFSKLQENIKD